MDNEINANAETATDENNLIDELDAIESPDYEEVEDAPDDAEESSDEGEKKEGDEKNDDTGEEETETKNVPEKKEEETTEEEKKEDKTEEKKQEKFTLKINGKTKEVDSVEDLIKFAQMGLAANEKFMEASKTQKAANEILNAAKSKNATTLLNALEKHGITYEEFRGSIEYWLGNEVMKENVKEKDPKLFEMMQKAEAADKYKAELDAKTKEEEQRVLTERQRYYAEQYDKEFTAALEKTEVPITPYSIRRISMYKQSAIERNVPHTTDELAQLVKEDYVKEIQAMVQKVKPEEIETVIGKNNLDRVRKFDVDKVKQKQRKKEEEEEDIKTSKDIDSFDGYSDYLDKIEDGEF